MNGSAFKLLQGSNRVMLLLQPDTQKLLCSRYQLPQQGKEQRRYAKTLATSL